ncbi:MAG TPA: S41 family peptidase [Pyrinomonadaceae bacterium]|nr:S41 family peptidase [Pyrinomonadaceae bacterium]
MSSKTFWRAAAVAVLLAATLVGGIAGRRAFGVRSGDGHAVEAAFQEALRVVAENYVDPPQYEKASEAAIQGMLWSLDPHSNFFTKEQYQRLLQDQESRFTGIGVSILRHRDGVYVQTPLPNTPAARAGLRFGDRIVEVDGKDAREWTTPQVSKEVRGPEGERVTIKVERAGSEAPLFFTIVRASVPQPSIRNAFMARPGVGYVGLTGGFTQTSGEELAQTLERLRGEGMRQVVLDLRNNPGGLLGQSIEVAGRFVSKGKTIVSVRGRDESEVREYKNTSIEPVDHPLVILINRNSASASEIVAGAVQDHGRGLIVGETSFGKGLVQRVFQLPYGAGLTLTTAKYYTPYGRLIQRDYSGGSLYDYYVRHDPAADARPPSRPTNVQPPNEAAPSPTPSPTPAPTGPAIRTAAGRVFYGGAGITPDYEVKPLEVATPVRARIAEESFHFVRRLVAGQVAGLEGYRLTEGPQFARYPRPTDLPVNDRLVEAFRDFARRDPESGLTPSQLEAEADYVRLRLRDDIVTAAYGGDASGRFLLESDPQLLRALELLPEARALAENIGRGLALK